MATTVPSVTSAIRQQTTTLLEIAKEICNNDTLNTEETYVNIAVLKGTHKTLSDLCHEKISNGVPKDIEEKLKKAQSRLDRAEQLNTFLRSESDTEVDPRVKRLMEKITRQSMQQAGSRFDESNPRDQLIKWDRKLLRCISSRYPNGPTQQQIEKGRSLINEIDMNLLKTAPQIVTFNHALLSRSSDRHYQGQSNIVECKKMASAFYAKQYLEQALLYDDHRFDNNGIGRQCDESAHESAAEYFKKHGTGQEISTENLFPGNEVEELQAVSSPANFECPSHANEDEIQTQIDNLIQLKNTHRLKSIGAFIEIKPQMLAIVLHPSGRISLVHPCGSKTRPSSYEANFVNSRHAAVYLRALIAEMATNQSILFKPYSRVGLIGEAMMEKIAEAIVENTDSNHTTFNLDFAPSSSSIQSSSNGPKTLAEIAPDVVTFQKIIAALSLKSKQGLSQAKPDIEVLKSRGAIFSMAGQMRENAYLRICYHLYFIQYNENPNKVNRSDFNWGDTAFKTEELATPEERLRAVQRAQIDRLFSLIDTAIQMDDNESIRLYLDALEELKLDPNDLPKGENNAAHALFGKLYQVYVEERKVYQDRVNPEDPQFKGNFGRTAFRAETDADIPGLIKTQTLRKVIQAFKNAWGYLI